MTTSPPTLSDALHDATILLLPNASLLPNPLWTKRAEALVDELVRHPHHREARRLAKRLEAALSAGGLGRLLALEKRYAA